MKVKIIFALNFVYFIVFNCHHVSYYTCICNFAKDMDFEGLPSTNDYAIYGNVVSEREFVTAISQHIESKQVEEIRSNLYFYLFLYEFTYIILESHFIIYLLYIDNDRLGQIKSLFLLLSAICNDIAQSIYNAWINIYISYIL